MLICNAYLMNPADKTEGAYDIFIENGRIAKIGKDLDRSCFDNVIDATGLIAAPGLVDVHSHFRDPGFTYKEDIESGARAAARGGYTTVVLMANTSPAVDNEETLRYVQKKASAQDIHIYTCATVTRGMKGREIVPMEELHALGAVGFTDDGVPVLDGEVVKKAMERAKKLGVPISLHEEDPAFIQNNGIHAGKVAEKLGIGGSMREAEIALTERDLRIAAQTGACINVQHISSREAVELVKKARAAGVNVHAEATPHHFTLTEEAVLSYGTLAKMNPPLREETDRQAIIGGLADGTIDLIATDHAPHSRDEKEKPLTEAPSGIIGLETALPLGITQLVQPGYLSMMQLLEKLTCNPAGLYHLDAGYIGEGGPADLVLFAADETDTVSGFASKSANSPFTGWRLSGTVHYTICNGNVVYEKE